MGVRCGIVGLPNVGKSTLFNALSNQAQAEAANYPFCTIEPNVGRVGVPDERLDKIATIASSAETIPTTLEFVDIAGLVRGASKGEGLGNQFLGHIREVDAILHVLRCFDDDDITHVEGNIDPLRDAEIVETELMLADIESLENRIPKLEKKAKGDDSDAKTSLALIQRALTHLHDGKPARVTEIDETEKSLFNQLGLLTAKPVLYICNVAESDAVNGNDFSAKVFAKAESEKAGAVLVTAAMEAELIAMATEERQEFLADIGLKETGLSRIIQAAYTLLDLQTFFTAGPKEARAWTIKSGSAAPQAAGVIHTDFERGFIAAETIAYDDYIGHNGESGAKEAGKWRTEGRDYTMVDGDVVHFRFNV